MTKRRIKVEIPIRQPDKLIELTEAICKRHAIEPVFSGELDIKNLYKINTEAKQKRGNAKELFEKAKILIQESNTLLGLAKGQTKATSGTGYSVILLIRDFLKALHKGDEEKLLNWGFDVEIFQIRSLRKVKIHIPISNPEMMIALGESIARTHTLDTSVLKSFNIKDFYSKIIKAKEKRIEAKKLDDKGDKLIEESNILLGIGYGQTKESEGTVYNMVNVILKRLLDKFKDSEENLNSWGFKTNVVTSSFPIKGSGITTKKITAITRQYPLITLHIIFKGTIGKKVYVSWGDGTAEKVNFIGHTTPNSIYHDYLQEGEYQIEISGDIGKLSYFRINGNQIVSIDIPKNLKNLINVSLKNNLIDSHKVINDFFSNLDSAGVFNGELDISGGSNAHPSSFGTISKNNLISRGWEIITN